MEAMRSMMADTQQHQHQQQYHQPGDEESYYSEPTPIPNEYRPPPPTFQPAPKNSAASGGNGGYVNHRHPENSLLNSTLLSLSVDDGETLPSLAFNPPSPLSPPSQSLFEDHNLPSTAAQSQAQSHTTAIGTATGTPANAKTSATPSKALSLARRRRTQQRQLNISTVSEIPQEPPHETTNNNIDKTSPPVHEFYMNDTEFDDDKNYPQQESSESETYFECIEDRSLANRARRTMRTDSHSSSNHQRSVPSSPDGHLVMPKLYSSSNNNQQYNSNSNNSNNNNNEKGSSGQRLENIQENIGSDDVVRVHESALNALQQLKEELVKSNQRNEELTQERELWNEKEQNLRQQVMTLQATERQRDTDLTRLRQDHERLRAENEATEQQRNKLVEEKQKLEAQSRDSARNIKEFRHRIMAGDNRHKELKGQLDKLNEELEGALSTKGEMAAELSRAQTDRMELESRTEKLRKQLSEATQERDQTTSDSLRFEEELRTERKKLQHLRASSDSEIERLNSSLRKANEALHRLRAELTPKVRSAVQQNVSFDGMQQQQQLQHASMVTAGSSVAGTPFGPAPTLDSAIADRLARLRDSAERAHLIRAHKRELARIKADHDATIQQLEIDHTDALKKSAKQSDAKRKSEVEELAETLNQQHESHVEELEEEHRNRLSQLQKNYGRSQEETDESLEEALSRVAKVTQDHGREKGRRHALERTVEDLKRRFRTQQKELQTKHGVELEKRRRHWESEKEMLLGNLQRDCNSAFDNLRRGTNDNTTNNNNSNNNNNNWAASAAGAPTTAVRGTNVHIDATDATRPVLSQAQGHGHRPPPSYHHPPQRNQQQQQRQEATGPSPLSMDSAPFFPENRTNSSHLKVVAPVFGGAGNNHGTMGGATYIVPSPRRLRGHPTSPIEMFTGIGINGSAGGSPSIISKSYSDIDSVLRETEELVQSILN